MNKTHKLVMHLLLIRIATLSNVAYLYLSKNGKVSLTLLVIVFAYSTILLLATRPLARHTNNFYLLGYLDMTITAVIMWLSGGYFSSPYVLYVLATVLLFAFLLKIEYVLILTGYLLTLLALTLFQNNSELLRILIKTHQLDSYITGNLGVLAVALIISYPAHVTRRTKQLQIDNLNLQKERDMAESIISAISTSKEISNRELQILSYLIKMKSNREIADDLHISEATVRNHLYRIYRKMGVSTREEAMMLYHSNYGVKSGPKTMKE